MFWADKVALELKERKLPLEWVDDMKTPSGRVHVGALLGVVIHDLVFRALKDAGVNTKYTYVFENHDPMDDIPSYLPREKYEKYLGMPLFAIPSPVEGYKDFAEYYAFEFKEAFNAIGSYPEILWTKDLYTSGKMNPGIKSVLDNAEEIRNIYREMYKKDINSDWYPFQVYCESCGKVSTTRVYNWDGEFVYYRCLIDATEWTKGCGHEGRTTPFSDESGIRGKMPWKVEWAAKWQAIGVTVEGAGKDHMSRGGSHDLTSLVAKKILNYPIPYPVGYEFMLIGGKKMSSSKGRGFAASDIVRILPPELIRFLIVKMNIHQQTNFDPGDGDTIPRLFDEYQEYAKHYFDKKNDDEARIFELSQIGEVKKPLGIRFSTLAQWVQMPNMENQIKAGGFEDWAKYARIWVERFAPDSEKFIVTDAVPKLVENLSIKQREFLIQASSLLASFSDPEDLQKAIYEKAKEMNLLPKDAFGAIYIALLGKNHGPKAGWLLLSLDKTFLTNRFNLVEMGKNSEKNSSNITLLSKNSLFSLSNEVKEKMQTLSVGIAVINGVRIKLKDGKLEELKREFLLKLKDLTTEEISTFPEIISYRKIYKEMGVDWHSRRPSPEALLRRIALGKELYSVNTCVDAYNLVVLKHRVSVGAFDLDKISFPTELRFAQSGEQIRLLGDQEETMYKAGEVAYFDQNGGYNIDLNYRDSIRTAVTVETKNLYINVEGIYDISPEVVEQVLRETCEKIITYCGGEIQTLGLVLAS